MTKISSGGIEHIKISIEIVYDPPDCPQCGAYEWIELIEPWPEQLTHMHDKFWKPCEPDDFFVRPLIKQSARVLRENRKKEVAVINICGNCGLVVS
jgi:hypothetical protein